MTGNSSSSSSSRKRRAAKILGAELSFVLKHVHNTKLKENQAATWRLSVSSHLTVTFVCVFLRACVPVIIFLVCTVQSARLNVPVRERTHALVTTYLYPARNLTSRYYLCARYDHSTDRLIKIK